MLQFQTYYQRNKNRLSVKYDRSFAEPHNPENSWNILMQLSTSKRQKKHLRALFVWIVSKLALILKRDLNESVLIYTKSV